jgi:hypothetical protein
MTSHKTFSLDAFDNCRNDDDKMTYFNKFHGKVLSQFYIKMFDKMPYYKFLKKGEFTIYYEEIEDFIKKWYKSRNKNIYSRYIYDPTGKLNGLNLFTGYLWNYYQKVEEFDEKTLEDRQVILNHIDLLCDGKGLDYIYHWLYRLICQPQIKPTVALIFNGTQGCGKSIFWTKLGECVLGSSLWKSVGTVSKLMGKFSGSYLTSRLIILEELNMKDNKEHTERLKNNITNIRMEIQEKNKDERSINNFSGHVGLTNKDIPMVIQKNDRRFCVYGCRNETPNEKYFKRLVEAFENPNCIIAFIKFLKENTDMDNWHIEKDRYFSEEYMVIQQATSKNSLDKFFEELPKGEYQSCEILDRLIFFFTEKGWSYKAWNKTRLGLQLKKRFGSDAKRRTSDGFVWNIE